MSYNAITIGWLRTNNSDFILMPSNNAGTSVEDAFITKIYVKAEDYYQAWI